MKFVRARHNTQAYIIKKIRAKLKELLILFQLSILYVASKMYSM